MTVNCNFIKNTENLDGPHFCHYNPGMARPKKSEEDRRTKLFQLRLLEEEHKVFTEAARASGLEASSWARAVLLHEAKRIIGRKSGEGK